MKTALRTASTADGGYVAGQRFHAYYPDFQGNIRVVASDGEFLQSNHYYPYGLPFAEGVAPKFQPHKYSGKEFLSDRSLNLYDFHARLQDPIIDGFDRMDPCLEDFMDVTPYTYCNSNPIKFIDPTGCYKLYNFEEGEKYGVITITPSDLTFFYPQLLCDGKLDGVKAEFYANRMAGIPIIVVDDVDDLVNAISDLLSEETTFELIAFNSHGVPGKFRIGTDVISESTADNYAEQFSEMKPFFENKSVFIGACRVAEDGKGDELMNKLHQSLGATIFASSHPLPGGYTYDGSDYLNRPKSQSDPTKLRVDVYYMTYRVVCGDNKPRNTYDLRIFRSGKIMSKTEALNFGYDYKYK